jgi:LysM repeat protein
VRDDWRRYVAPAAFLLAATLAVVLVRSGMHAGATTTTTRASATTPRKTVAATTTTKKPVKPSGRKFWTVEAGDSFGVISTKTGVPVGTLERLNPGVSSTSLVIGQKVRIG